MKRNFRADKPASTLLLVLLLMVSLARPALSEVQEETLLVWGSSETQSSAAGRFSRPVSRTPENVTVLSAADVEALNAHTLADILATVPGIELENGTGPASVTYLHLQGSNFGQVLVLLDGIPFNNLSDNFADIGIIPAHIVDRIEIVKGAASSSWGQALGGVINVITKPPVSGQRAGGEASASAGQHGTDDAHAAFSGTWQRFGYRFAGGYFGSDGFHPNTYARLGNAHGRLSYELPGQGELLFSLYYSVFDRGELTLVQRNLQAKDSGHRLMMSASLAKPLTDRLDLELSAHNSFNHAGLDVSTLSNSFPLQSVTGDERRTGGRGKILWHQGENAMVLGVDYDHLRLGQNEALHRVDLLNRVTDRWGFYLNDTCSVGRFSFSPGVRYDLTGTSGNQFSPSLGVTVQLGENTTLRGYTARGYGLPSFNIERGAEKVWTSQLGAETSLVPHLWLKGTLFRNDAWDIAVVDPATGNLLMQRQLMQGVETEVKTTPVWNTSLSAGYTFVDARTGGDDKIVDDVPRHTILLGLHYDDGRLLRGQITGRHIDWHAASLHSASYGGFVWDTHLTVTPFGRAAGRPEIFFSLRNAFDGKQYLESAYENPGRWFEGGVRCGF